MGFESARFQGSRPTCNITSALKVLLLLQIITTIKSSTIANLQVGLQGGLRNNDASQNNVLRKCKLRGNTYLVDELSRLRQQDVIEPSFLNHPFYSVQQADIYERVCRILLYKNHAHKHTARHYGHRASQSGRQSDIDRRSTCKWRYKLSYKDERFPSKIPQAHCTTEHVRLGRSVSTTHRRTAPAHVNAAPAQANVVSAHADAAPTNVGAAPAHVDGAPHVGAAPAHVVAAPTHPDAAPAHVATPPTHKTTQATPRALVDTLNRCEEVHHYVRVLVRTDKYEHDGYCVYVPCWEKQVVGCTEATPQY